MNNRFIIFSSGFNCEQFVLKNISSVESQSYKNFKHILVDDASKDKTYNRIIEVENINQIVYKNTINKGWLSNAVEYLNLNVDDEDIIIILDLDDWFYEYNVLERLNNIYNEKKCWGTYGNLIRSDNGKSYYNTGYSDDVIRNKKYRGYNGWKWQALRTFKGFLWKNVDVRDLKIQNGEYAKGAYDRAIGYPILEMIPEGKNIYIPDILMVYNRNRKLNLDKVNKIKQKEWCYYFRNLPPYKTLER